MMDHHNAQTPSLKYVIMYETKWFVWTGSQLGLGGASHSALDQSIRS